MGVKPEMVQSVTYLLFNRETGKSNIFKNLKEAVQHFINLKSAHIRCIDRGNKIEEIIYIK